MISNTTKLATILVTSLITSEAWAIPQTPVQSIPMGGANPRVGYDPAKSKIVGDSYNLAGAGDRYAKQEDWAKAANCYRQSLRLWEANSQALYGAARCAEVSGDVSGAIRLYRLAIYTDAPGSEGYKESNVTKVMTFALALVKVGKDAEALAVYRHCYANLPTDRGPLPPLFTTPDFAANDFESAAYTAMGIYEMSGGVAADAPQDFDHAIASQPKLAAPYFYRGLELKSTPGRSADALADLSRAQQLGGPEMKPFVDGALNSGSIEFQAAVNKAWGTAAS